MIISRRLKKAPWRSPGVYGHWPKFWNCKEDQFVYRPGLADDEDFIKEMTAFYKGQAAAHQDCILGWHMSYKGYLRIVTPKHNFTFWYMGNPYRHKIFEHFRKDKWQ